MMHSEAKKFMDEVLAELWPDYEPTGRIVALWKSVLLKYDYATAEKAAEELKLSKFSGKTPDPGKFREIANGLLKDNAGNRQDGGQLYETDVFILCTEPDNRGGVGWILPVYIYPLGPEKPATEILCRHAHIIVNGIKDKDGTLVKSGLSHIYGGKYEIYEYACWDEMTHMRRELQKKYPPETRFKNAPENIGAILNK